MDKNAPEYYKQLSLKEIQEKVRQVKKKKPQEKQNIITYSRNFTLSLSNFCRNNCKYCYYNHRIPKPPENENVTLLGEKKIAKQIRLGKEFECKEALIMSGEKPSTFSEVKQKLEESGYTSFMEYVKEVCLAALENNLLPHINIGIMSYRELKQLKEYNASMGLMLESTGDALFKEGGVHEHSPGKKPKVRIEHIKNAGKLKIPFTTGLLIGIGETFEERVNDLFLIKEIHENYGHIQEVIIQNFECKKRVSYKPKETISMKEMLKITGIAKLLFNNEIAVQVPPNLIQGYEQQFLSMGIDDFGGISPFSQDFINPEKEWPKIEHLEEICERNGYVLEERLPIYKKYVDKPGFCSERIKKILEAIKI